MSNSSLVVVSCSFFYTFTSQHGW